MKLYLFVSSLLIGVYVALEFNLKDFYFYIFLVFLSLLILFFTNKENFKVGLIFFLTILFFAIGLIRTDIFLNSIPKINNSLIEKSNTYKALVVQPSDERENVVHTVLYIKDEDVYIRATHSFHPKLKYGDRVNLTGKLQLPENFTSEETGITFDYVNYLQKDNVQYVIFFPKIVVNNNDKKEDVSFVKSKLSELNLLIQQSLNKALPTPHSSLAAGILIGAKQALGKDLLEAFQIVGLIHIVVLSGYNVTIIVDAITRFLSVLPRPISITLSIVSIILFSILTGASATTVRAAIMAIISVIAITLRRTYSVHRALLIAAAIMVLENPYILLYDPGFQLSFVATLGLLYVSPKIEVILEKIKIPNWLTIRETLATTIATQIAVLPLLVNMMGYVSIISLVANLLVLPVIPIAMAVSAISGLLHWAGNIALPINLISYWLLEYVFIVTMYLAKVPWAVFYFK